MFARTSIPALAILALVAGCAPGGGGPAAVAQPGATGPGAPDRTVTTNVALGVFERVCVANPGSDAARRAAIASLGFREPPPFLAAPFLAGPAAGGTVWLRPDPPSVGVPVAVVTRTSGVPCQVLAPVADAGTAATRFTATMEALVSPGRLNVRKIRDDAALPGGVPGRLLAYLAAPPSVSGVGLLFSMTARDSERPGGVALILTMSPARE